VREALAGLDVPADQARSASIKRYVIFRKWVGLARGAHDDRYFGLYRIDPDRPCQTIVTTGGSGSAALTHWSEPRYMTVPELKRLSSFPDDFQFLGTLAKATHRIGNSVPPRLMRAVAANLARSPFIGGRP
jgi:DNA (cytosine-5)-methyltransferase 1